MATGTQHGGCAPQRRGPLVVVEEHLRDVAGHQGDVEVLGDREVRRARLDPADLLGARLGASHVQGRDRRVDPHDLETARRQYQREYAGAASDVEHAAAVQLVDQRDVVTQVGTVGVQRVVETRESRIVEDQVRHRPTLAPPDRPVDVLLALGCRRFVTVVLPPASVPGSCDITGPAVASASAARRTSASSSSPEERKVRTEIGTLLGVTRQIMHRKYRKVG